MPLLGHLEQMYRTSSTPCLIRASNWHVNDERPPRRPGLMFSFQVLNHVIPLFLPPTAQYPLAHSTPRLPFLAAFHHFFPHFPCFRSHRTKQQEAPRRRSGWVKSQTALAADPALHRRRLTFRPSGDSQAIVHGYDDPVAKALMA
jgi:hypothetical protein